MRKIAWGVLAAASMSVSPAALLADADSFAGEQIEFVVGFNPGGTYDLYSRIAAEWLPRYIPGEPTIVVQNMPGVGGRIAANYLHRQASQDGLTIGMIGQASGLQQVIDRQGTDYEITEFNWIGRFAPAVEVTVVWNDATPIRSLEDAKEHAVALGGTSAGSTSEMMPRIMNGVLGTQFEVVLGYQGATGAVYAMESGEVEGAHSTVPTLSIQYAEWLENDVVSVLVQYSVEPHPDFPDVPTMTDFATNEAESQILSLFASTAEIGRAIVAPPNVPEERLAILRDAFDEMVADPEFQAALEERNLPFGPMSGANLQTMVDGAVQVDEATVERILAILDDENGG